MRSWHLRTGRRGASDLTSLCPTVLCQVGNGSPCFAGLLSRSTQRRREGPRAAPEEVPPRQPLPHRARGVPALHSLPSWTCLLEAHGPRATLCPHQHDHFSWGLLQNGERDRETETDAEKERERESHQLPVNLPLWPAWSPGAQPPFEP